MDRGVADTVAGVERTREVVGRHPEVHVRGFAGFEILVVRKGLLEDRRRRGEAEEREEEQLE